MACSGGLPWGLSPSRNNRRAMKWRNVTLSYNITSSLNKEFNMKSLAIAVICLIGLSACQTYTMGRYTSSVDNVLALRKLSPKTVNVSAFSAVTPDNKEILCVGRIYIRTQDGEDFSKFIEKSLISEMKMAGIYSPDAKTTISGILEHVDASYGQGRWELKLTLKSSNGKTATYSDEYQYPRGLADSACMIPAQAFVPAVQDLINKIVTY